MNNKLLSFYKMSGGGNDFVLFDNRKENLPKNYSPIAKNVCDRKFSIGADGMLVLEKTQEAHFRMIYFNADGSRAEMCGNGARCIARFAFLLAIAPEKMTFLTDAGILSAEIDQDFVKLQMSKPKDLKLDFPLKLEEGKELHISFINTGVPHVVLIVTDTDKTQVDELGRAIRYHREFAPAGTNVNFVEHKDLHNLIVRTYERGVEDETLACGTGVVASSLICATKNLVESPVSCLTKGGETLKIHFHKKEDNTFTDVFLEGPVKVCYKGEIEL
ncbi:MAG: diaminopimelate epimerase [Elusimicrobia bacterium RIFCSPLOWO2_02_FULL_39_32]|nr:MAG: diaminopimelate epimerase [Elusimicrobia bacterium GWA2_38_7]OGR79008.1 MAG: diaminopimelate epimerase [Elusimicrobia bacterium RIFCSPHIGHO2_02_FULL_39_36]OGR92592.1 MAG: diaminopimelate epimerase [Elusimicrobia bacterium RIFCSPLOWO2_02_FULL_39_32]OGR99239.1 MAG: diaminopimelate epimerase [Elusimicrobia bacterium RIFCSPLOWO2_12_FULL_39_28]